MESHPHSAAQIEAFRQECERRAARDARLSDIALEESRRTGEPPWEIRKRLQAQCGLDGAADSAVYDARVIALLKDYQEPSNPRLDWLPAVTMMVAALWLASLGAGGGGAGPNNNHSFHHASTFARGISPAGFFIARRSG